GGVPVDVVFPRRMDCGDAGDGAWVCGIVFRGRGEGGAREREGCGAVEYNVVAVRTVFDVFRRAVDGKGKLLAGFEFAVLVAARKSQLPGAKVEGLGEGEWVDGERV